MLLIATSSEPSLEAKDSGLAGNADSAKKVLELMKRAGVPPTAEAYTSLMSACMKQGSPENIAYAFEVSLFKISDEHHLWMSSPQTIQ